MDVPKTCIVCGGSSIVNSSNRIGWDFPINMYDSFEVGYRSISTGIILKIDIDLGVAGNSRKFP